MNGQKREAITRGRLVMGLRGQGKGNKIERVETSEDDAQSFGLDDAEGEDDFYEEAGDEVRTDSPVAHVKPARSSARKSTRKARYKVNSDDDDEYVENPIRKKIKRERSSHSNRQGLEGGHSRQVIDSHDYQGVDITHPTVGANDDQYLAMNTLPRIQAPRVQQYGHNYGYTRILGWNDYHPYQPSGAASMSNANPHWSPGYYSPQLGHYPQHPQQWNPNAGCSSDVEHDASDQSRGGHDAHDVQNFTFENEPKFGFGTTLERSDETNASPQN